MKNGAPLVSSLCSPLAKTYMREQKHYIHQATKNCVKLKYY